MNSFVLPLLMGQPAGAESGGPMGGIMSFLPFIAIIAIFYFLIIRPQNKKQKETKKMLETLKKGDRIITIGGIHGTIQTVREQSVIVRVDDTTKIEFSRSAISSVVSVAKEEKNDSKDEEEKESESESEKK